MKGLLCGAVLLFVSVTCTAQPTAIQSAHDRNICTNVVAITGNLNLNCSNLTPEQKKFIGEIPSILKMAVTSQNYLEEIKARMDEMTTQQTNNQSCGNGSICNQGSTVGAPQTVINTAPPAQIEGYEVVPPNPEKDKDGHPITTFRFYLSNPVADQKFIAICDRPCTALSANTSPSKSIFSSDDVITGNIDGEPQMAAWIINYTMHAEQYQVFTVSSKDNAPVTITRFAFGKFPVKPQ